MKTIRPIAAAVLATLAFGAQADAGVWGGLHFRTATKVAEQMGAKVGGLAAQRLDPGL